MDCASALADDVFAQNFLLSEMHCTRRAPHNLVTRSLGNKNVLLLPHRACSETNISDLFMT